MLTERDKGVHLNFLALEQTEDRMSGCSIINIPLFYDRKNKRKSPLGASWWY